VPPPPHPELLRSLEEKTQPGRAALVVIDMQNDFCHPEGMMAREGFDTSAVEAMGTRLPRLLHAARAAGVLVVFVRNVYSTEANWYLSDVWLEQAARRRGGSYTERAVCPPESWSGDFYGEVRPRPDEVVVTKHRFCAFTNTDLDLVLRSHGIRTIVLTGVATNACVETTARAGFVRDYYVVFTSDGTATYDQEAHGATLRTIDLYFGEVVTIDALVALWQPGRAASARGDATAPVGAGT
jgi:ureidoacrylate peracid hydrolase